MKKQMCYNCKHASEPFKVINMTHVHCFDEKQYPKEKCESGEVSPWETLREFWNKCENQQLKDK